ncbi:MAG TPA: DUF4870 domain-containing protein [Phycisphaerae bacterium]|nr:DUF4870 domain-containing protein [Phycisphaerae bacterium]
MINFECSKCHASLAVDDNQAGLSAQCPQCGNINPVPGASRVNIEKFKARCAAATLSVPDEKSRLWCALCHLGGLLPSVPMNIIIPLVFWLIKKDELPAVDEHGRAAINFQLTCTVAYVISFLLLFVAVGFFLLAAVAIFNFIVCLIAVIRTANGQDAKYPFLIRFLA